MNRIETIYSWISQDESFVDIGTDHAYLPILAVESSHKGKIYAREVISGPFAIAKKNIGERPVELSMGDGLLGFDQEVDVIVIAGMGGNLIAKIISDSMLICKKAKRMILQPMQQMYELRLFLYKNNFRVVKEEIVKSNEKFFLIFEVIVGQEDLYDFTLGKDLAKNKKNLRQYYQNMLKCNQRILQELPRTHEKRRMELIDLCNRIRTKLSNRSNEESPSSIEQGAG